MNIPQIRLKCKAGHEWLVTMPPWWAAWDGVKCPECEGVPYSFKMGQYFVLGQDKFGQPTEDREKVES